MNREVLYNMNLEDRYNKIIHFMQVLTSSRAMNCKEYIFTAAAVQQKKKKIVELHWA